MQAPWRPPDITVYDTGLANFVVKYENSGKHKAIEYMIKNGLLDPEQTMFIGDGVNDVRALKLIRDSGGIAVAVKNATEDAKDSASIITRGSESEGVIEALEGLVIKAIRNS